MLRKNTASQYVYFALVNATTGAALTGASVTGRRIIDGTAAAIGATITEPNSDGFYQAALTAADTNGNNIGYFFTATNAVPVGFTVVTTSLNPYDAAAFGMTNLDGTVTSRLAPTVAGRTLDVSEDGEAGLDWANIGSPTTVQGLSGTTIKTATDVETDTANIQSRLPAALVSGRIDASVGAVADNAITAAAIATGAIDADALSADAVAEIADGVWDEAIAGHLTAGSTGNALNSAGSAGDPWSTALPGAYGAGTAGKIVGDNLNATVSSRSTLDQAGVRTAVGLGAANLDTQLSTIDTVVDSILDDTGTAGVVVAAGSKTGYQLSATGVDDILDEAADGAVTLRQSVRLWNSALGGIASGLETTTAVYRDLANTKDRITATVDADGNRTAVVRDLT